MNKNHGRGWLAALVVFLAAVYSVLLFILKSEFTMAHWIAYGFTMAAFLLTALDALVPFSASKKYPMFDLPMSIFTCVYFVIQLIVGGIIAMRMPELSPKTAILVGFVILAAYVAISLIMMAGSSHVTAIGEQDVKNTGAMRRIKADLDTVASIAQDQAVKQRIARLSEEIAYSDPVSSDGLHDVEERLKNNIAMLREDVEDGENDRVQKRIEKIGRLIDERKHLCAALKR